MRRVLALAVALCLIIPSAMLVTRADASKHTWTVIAGGGIKGTAVVSNVFSPNTIEVAIGDTVTWNFQPPWAVHTVSFLSGQKPPDLEIHEGNKVYLSPQVFFPAGPKTYDGTGYLNSGAPPLDPKAKASYSLRFTKAGTYEYMNLLHGTSGKVIVKDRAMESAASVRARGQRDLAATLKAGQAAFSKWKAERQGDTVVLPMIGDAKAGWAVFRFSNGPVVINRGTTVTWTMRDPTEIHTVTFLAGQKLPDFVIVEPQKQGPPKLLMNPKFSVATQATTYEGGFANSGILYPPEAPPNLPKSYSLTFPKPGRYAYTCAIHDAWGMRGTIVVR